MCYYFSLIEVEMEYNKIVQIHSKFLWHSKKYIEKSEMFQINLHV